MNLPTPPNVPNFIESALLAMEDEMWFIVVDYFRAAAYAQLWRDEAVACESRYWAGSHDADWNGAKVARNNAELCAAEMKARKP